MSQQQQPSVGRIIHYVLKEGRSAGQHRPGIIVNTFDGSGPHVNARIFLDWSNDAGNEFNKELEGHAFSCPHDPEGNMPGSWHFPEFVPPVAK